MLLIKEKGRVEKYKQGFALIELITVMAILGITFGVLVPSFLGTIKRTKKKVCSMNTSKVEEMYETYLYEEGKDHSGIIFNKYIGDQDKDICPDSGLVTYEGGKVKCSVHLLDKDDHDEGDVPYL